MAEQEIQLLKEQIDRLNDKKFDLDAWKNRTVIFLERIFGAESPKIRMIQNLRYDYSSWSLRDTAAGGSEKDKDPTRIQAREILEATIAELQTLGLPENKKERLRLWEILEDELTGKQLRELEALSKGDDPQKLTHMAEIIASIPNENLTLALAKLLTS